MSKAYLTPFLPLAFSLLFVFAGCNKKDDQSSSFSVTGDSSLHFEYAQTKVIGFESRNIQKFDEADVPKGWTCTINQSNSTITITSPANGTAGAEWDGDVDLTAITGAGGELTKTLEVAVKIAEQISQPANCFLITETNTRYKFDARRKGNDASASLSPAGAKLVWTTVKDAVSHVSLEGGFIYFATDDETELVEANALIAAVDGDDKIIWSWHIWVADYDLEDDANLDELENEVVMDRNLGAFASSGVSSDDAFASYGLYYQWGRKDPFVGPNAWNSTVQQYTYNSSGKAFSMTFETTDSGKGTTAYATANPTNYIIGIEGTDYDWLYAGHDNSLWNKANSTSGVTETKGTKNIYDPCPAGWMVAPAYIWQSFTKDGAVADDTDDFNVDNEYLAGSWFGWIFNDGTEGAEAVSSYYPAAGRRSFSKTSNNFTNVIVGDPVGYYWSNTAATASESATLVFNKEYVNPGAETYGKLGEDGGWSAEGARAGGFPLRCVKE